MHDASAPSPDDAPLLSPSLPCHAQQDVMMEIAFGAGLQVRPCTMHLTNRTQGRVGLALRTLQFDRARYIWFSG